MPLFYLYAGVEVFRTCVLYRLQAACTIRDLNLMLHDFSYTLVYGTHLHLFVQLLHLLNLPNHLLHRLHASTPVQLPTPPQRPTPPTPPQPHQPPPPLPRIYLHLSVGVQPPPGCRVRTCGSPGAGGANAHAGIQMQATGVCVWVCVCGGGGGGLTGQLGGGG